MMGGIRLSTLPCPKKKGTLRFAGGTCIGEGPAVQRTRMGHRRLTAAAIRLTYSQLSLPGYPVHRA